MKRRWKILIAVGAVLCAAVLISIVQHYQLRYAVEKYISKLKAQGEPMELAQVVPTPVPPEKNGASLVTNALSQLEIEEDKNYTNSLLFKNDPIGMSRSIAPGEKIVGWHLPFIHDLEDYGAGYYYPTNTWEDLGVQLKERQDNLRDFRKLIQNPMIYFNYDYSDPQKYIPALAPHLSQFKLAIRWLEASEFYSLHEGKTADACTDVRVMLSFIKAETNERFLISQLVRLAFARIAADATWNVLQATNVSDADLAQLQQDWESLKFIVPLKNAFLFERVDELRLVSHLRQTPRNLDAQVVWAEDFKPIEGGSDTWIGQNKFLQKAKEKISNFWDALQWRWFWSYTDEIRGVRMWRAVIDGTQMLETNRSFLSVQSFVMTNFTQISFDSVKDNPYAMISQYAHNQLSATKRLAEVETARNVVVTAIALKRYKLRYHHLPDSLDELIPEFLKSVPTDFMDGGPLRYRRNADGTFLLYSVGDNGKDDGGNPRWKKTDITPGNYDWQNGYALDWVWPQPATEAEVQKFYSAQEGKSD